MAISGDAVIMKAPDATQKDSMQAPGRHPTRTRLGDRALLVARAVTLLPIFAIFAIAAFVIWVVMAVSISVGRDTSEPLTVGEHLDVFWPAWTAAAVAVAPGLWVGYRHLRHGMG